MKVFISHKIEDAIIARKIQLRLMLKDVESYLDLLDTEITNSGKALTDHIKKELNDCTDIIVVMSENTRYSQWVPFEVGMSAQIDMPTATFLKSDVMLPSFLTYWPRLKELSDIDKYVSTRLEVAKDMDSLFKHRESPARRKMETEKFYNKLKFKL